jgi:hypothetical protein
MFQQYIPNEPKKIDEKILNNQVKPPRTKNINEI